ncbi:conserved oligomeric Golgi complex subunit 7 isoform X1 [Plodia interpunctella]|uniref:conserved oligomeric Golgi complex subunit 7 isoform X1 n=1 Tax=Plodia interpunctella TaxID=58824 RepID=UPI0023677F7D|nr:conserved oligomeric Golgi complex subunit 7 isoform X2 [Plodia interpunctella]
MDKQSVGLQRQSGERGVCGQCCYKTSALYEAINQLPGRDYCSVFQIVTSVPRILQSAEALQDEGQALQYELHSLEHKLTSVEQQTGNSIESLQRIDRLKSTLENAASALREADKWAMLAAALEHVLETGVPTQKEQLAELTQQLHANTACLEVLSDAPDYESKRLQLETLYNRLEAAVTPPLIEALTDNDVDRTSTYLALFVGMGRGLSVCRCWRRAAASRLASKWSALESHSVGALTRMLIGEANNQVDWLTNVLKSDSPIAELLRLYTDLLLSLEPTPTLVVSANLKLCSTPEEGIVMLTDLKTDIDGFISCIRGVMDAPRSNREKLLPATVRELGRAAYAPLRELLPRYTELQSRLLIEHLNDPQLQQTDDIVEHSRSILSLASRSEGWLEIAYSRAEKIAGRCVYPFYVPALENFVQCLSNTISAHYRRIEALFRSTVAAGQSTGVLSPMFPAALILESATAVLLDAIANRLNIEPKREPAHPLLDLATLVLEPDSRRQLAKLQCQPPTFPELRRVKNQLKTLARAVLRNPIDVILDEVPQLPVWSNNDALSTDLPDFAISPQEYITKIGQYLMTLPHHLEMHLSEKQAPLQFLTEVCTHTCDMYAEKLLNIRNMDALGTKRCLTDIVYLCSVAEDLGSSAPPALRRLEQSLRVAA